MDPIRVPPRLSPDAGEAAILDVLAGPEPETCPRDCAADEVCSFEMDENPVPTKTNPLGVKGAGEAGNVGALAAIMNAVVDALSPLGIAHIDMPATPEKVWRTIRAAQAR